MQGVPASDLGLSTELSLRRATPQDIPALRALIDLSVRTLHVSYYTSLVIELALKSVYGVDTTLVNDGHYFVIEVQSSPRTRLEIIACGGWSHRTTLYGGDQFDSRNPTLLDPSQDAAKIRAMFVHPDWTRKGIGKILITACEDAAREAGFKKVEMGATLSGVPFYQRMGYEILEGEERKLGDGEVLTLKRMGRELESI